MRIAQIAPLFEPVPPKLYGGTERVVSYLTEELVRRGHQVTLFASGDSRTAAELHGILPRSIRLDPDPPDPYAYHILELGRVFSLADKFDIIHCHLEYMGFPFACATDTPCVHTLHGRLDYPYWGPLMECYRHVALVSISNDQRKPLLDHGARWMGTVYHGLPESCFRPGKGKGGYLAFFSRMSREKRPDLAVEVARRTNIPLKIAGKVDKLDEEYFHREVEPLLDHPLVEFLGELDEKQRIELLGNAIALLFPIQWPEPFGLVMIEAMANGTPVIGTPYGSVPEVVDPGITGLIVRNVDEMVQAVGRVSRIDRGKCFSRALERFSVQAMTGRYEEIYEAAISQNRSVKPVRQKDISSGIIM